VKLIPEGEKLPVVPEYTLGQGFDEQIDIVLPPEVPMQPRNPSTNPFFGTWKVCLTRFPGGAAA
jgi:hypothetical protein